MNDSQQGATQTTYLQRSIFFVSDLEQSLPLFTQLLGFTENYRLEHELDTFSHRLFGLPAGLPTTFVTLDLPGQERCLALLAPESPFDRQTRAASAGLVIRVDSVDAVYERVALLGLKCEAIKREINPQHGPPRTEGAFYDYDGHPIVIFDFNPSVKL